MQRSDCSELVKKRLAAALVNLSRRRRHRLKGLGSSQQAAEGDPDAMLDNNFETNI